MLLVAVATVVQRREDSTEKSRKHYRGRRDRDEASASAKEKKRKSKSKHGKKSSRKKSKKERRNGHRDGRNDRGYMSEAKDDDDGRSSSDNEVLCTNQNVIYKLLQRSKHFEHHFSFMS